MYYDVYPKEEKAKQPTAFKARHHPMSLFTSTDFPQVVCKGKNEEIVGLHILGKGCDEMMQVRYYPLRRSHNSTDMTAGIWCCGENGRYQKGP